MIISKYKIFFKDICYWVKYIVFNASNHTDTVLNLIIYELITGKNWKIHKTDLKKIDKKITHTSVLKIGK